MRASVEKGAVERERMGERCVSSEAVMRVM
jgi:hypothetical protein